MSFADCSDAEQRAQPAASLPIIWQVCVCVQCRIIQRPTRTFTHAIVVVVVVAAAVALPPVLLSKTVACRRVRLCLLPTYRPAPSFIAVVVIIIAVAVVVAGAFFVGVVAVIRRLPHRRDGGRRRCAPPSSAAAAVKHRHLPRGGGGAWQCGIGPRRLSSLCINVGVGVVVRPSVRPSVRRVDVCSAVAAAAAVCLSVV